MSSEFFSERDLSLLPASSAAQEPLDAATYRLLLANLQHRLESRTQPLISAVSTSSQKVFDEDFVASGRLDVYELGRMVPVAVLWVGYLPVLDGGRLPDLYVEALLDVSGTPLAGDEPAIAVAAVTGSSPDIYYPRSTTADSSGPGWIGRKIDALTLWRPAEPIRLGVPAGGDPWQQVWIVLYVGQRKTSGAVAGENLVVEAIYVRAYGGEP